MPQRVINKFLVKIDWRDLAKCFPTFVHFFMFSRQVFLTFATPANGLFPQLPALTILSRWFRWRHRFCDYRLIRQAFPKPLARTCGASFLSSYRGILLYSLLMLRLSSRGNEYCKIERRVIIVRFTVCATKTEPASRSMLPRMLLALH